MYVSQPGASRNVLLPWEVVVNCSCPNEVSSARVALKLHSKGITRVRPLLGGLDAWRDLNYPLEPASRPPKTLAMPTPISQQDKPLHGNPAAHDKSSSRDNLDKAA